MDKIYDFQFINKHQGYDAINNPDRLNQSELLPIGIKWKFNGSQYSIVNEDGVIGVILEKRNELAIIEGMKSFTTNKAYIVNGKGALLWNIGELLYKQKHVKTNKIFFVYNENDLVYFLFNNSLCDYRFSIDPITGEISDFDEVKW